MRAAIRIIRVSRSVAAKTFYCEKLGFTEVFVYRPDCSLVMAHPFRDPEMR